MRRIGMRSALGFAILAAVAMVVVGLNQSVSAQGNSERVPVGRLMAGIMRPNFGAARGAARNAPADDDAWEALANNAAALNEMSFLVLEGGRNKGNIWQDAARNSLRQGSAQLLAAAEAKNAGGIADAVQVIGQACRTCHDEYRN